LDVTPGDERRRHMKAFLLFAAGDPLVIPDLL